MGKYSNIPIEHQLSLKQLFEEDAKTLPRVLAGCTFQWKPGMKGNLEKVFSTYKKTILEEIKKARSFDLANPGGPAEAAPPAQSSGWQSASPRGTASNRAAIGGHRGAPPPVPARPQSWQSATPSGAGGKTTIGSHRIPLGLLETLDNLATSFTKTTTVDAVALAFEGVTVGVTEAANAISDTLPNVVDLRELITEIAGTAAAELAFEIAAAIPFVGAALGIAKNFTSTASGLFTAGMKQWTIQTVKTESKIITAGNPREAIEGLKVMLKRKRNDALYRASLEGAHGAARAVALAGDVGALGTTGGTISSVVGIAGGLVKLALNLAQAIARALQDFREMYVGAKLLMFPGQMKVSALAKDCPLLCCYLITEASPSALIGFLSEGTMGANWMDQVEELLPQIQDLQRIASVCEHEMPYKLVANKRFYGNPTGGQMKSHSILSERLRDMPAQVMHDVMQKLKKDPRALPYTTKMWFEKITATVMQGPNAF